MKNSQNYYNKEDEHKDHRFSYHKVSHSHSNHGLTMLLAHIVPIGLIIILPLLGFTGSWTFIVPIFLMIGIHLWMMKEHFTEHKKEVHKV